MIAKVNIEGRSGAWRFQADLFDEDGRVDSDESGPLLEGERDQIALAAAIQGHLLTAHRQTGPLFLAL